MNTMGWKQETMGTAIRWFECQIGEATMPEAREMYAKALEVLREAEQCTS